jgi:tripartite-type tricarboxylate transporter receptor subunit TctC
MSTTRVIAFISLFLVTILEGGVSFTDAAQSNVTYEKPVADFYKGKTVRIIVGYSAGGGYDLYSRLIARHISKYIPGNPTVIVENMPGAGSIIAANHVYNAAPKDGTVIGNVSGPIILEQIFNSPAVQFDMANFRYLVVPIPDTYLMIVAKKSGITKIEDVFATTGKQLVVGAIPASTLEHAGILFRDTLGANIKLVSGYKGTADIRMAIEGGEIEAFFNSWASLKVTSHDKFSSGQWLITAQLADSPLPDLPFANVPTIAMLAKTDQQRQLLRFATSIPNRFAKVYITAPAVPEERAAALEAAFMKVMADKEFLEDARKGKLEVSPIPGDQIHKLVLEFLGMSPELKSKLRTIVKPADK